MEINNNYKFITTVSKDCYNTKVEASAAVNIAIRKLLKKDRGISIEAAKWREVETTPQQLLSGIINGYSWSPGLYLEGIRENMDTNGYVWKDNKSGFKYREYPFDDSGYIKNGYIKEEYWRKSYCMFIDIDNTNYPSMNDYISRLTITPTFGYYTMSDTPQDRRFKLVYVFDSCFNNQYEWKKVSEFIHFKICEDTGEQIKDKCGTVLTQLSFRGANYDAFLSNIIYSRIDFFQVIQNAKTEEQQEAESITGKSSDNVAINQKLIRILERNFKVKDLKYIDFTDRIYRTEDEVYWDKGFTYEQMGLTTTDYWQLIPRPLKDGQQRRKNLFRRMCLRRIIRPTATPEDILLNAYMDREMFVDNSDGVVSVENLVRNVQAAFTYEIDELKEKFKNTIEYLKANAPAVIFKNTKIPVEQRRVIQKHYNRYIINKLYDKNKTEEENLNNINRNFEEKNYNWRIKSRITLRNYRKAYNKEKTTHQDRTDFILDKHDEGLTANQIKDELDNNGFDLLSKSQINRVIKSGVHSTSTTNDTVEDCNVDDADMKFDATNFLRGCSNTLY